MDSDKIAELIEELESKILALKEELGLNEEEEFEDDEEDDDSEDTPEGVQG